MHLQEKSPVEVPIGQESDTASHITSKWQNQDLNSSLSYWKVTINNDNDNSRASVHSYYVPSIVANVKPALHLH